MAGLLIWFACQTGSTSTTQYAEPYPDERFTSLFNLDSGGFTGGDGTYSVQLPDGRTVWIFGDTFLGKVERDSTRKRQEPMFIRNSFVVQDGERMTTVMQQLDGENSSTMIPPEVLEGKVTQDSTWYWPGDGMIEDGQLKVFVSKFTQVDTSSWGFRWIGTGVVSFSLPYLTQQEVVEFPMEKLDSIHFGHAVLETKDYTYIYGLKGSKPYLARVKAGDLTASWQYFVTLDEWSLKASEARPVAEIDGSEQFSLIERDGRFALITQLGGFSKEVWSFRGPNPWGPWDEGKHLFSTPLAFDNPNLFTYNALAHPQFVQGGELLISYNTNSFRLQDHFDNALIYRPRFYRVHISSVFED